jgi:GNAT superfamily N-acetyltransferase
MSVPGPGPGPGPRLTLSRPAPGSPLGAAAAQAASRSRLSLRRLFPADPRYARAFCALAPGQCIVASDADQIRGVLLTRVNGRDGFALTAARFTALYGVVGLLRLALTRAVEALTSGPATHISAFWVDPAYRGGGIGAALLTRLTTGTPAEITLLARPGRTAFYARHGFAIGGPARLRLIATLIGMTAMRRAPQNRRPQ